MWAWIMSWAVLASAGAAPTPPPHQPDSVHYRYGERAGTIIIRSIDVKVPVYQGTGHNTILSRGVGHSRRSDWPCDGTGIYWGHNITPMPTLGLPHGPFHHINRLKRGDQIKMKMEWDTCTYKVKQHWIIPVDEVASFFVRSGRSEIYLAKCWPDYSSDNRYIVRAVLQCRFRSMNSKR